MVSQDISTVNPLTEKFTFPLSCSFQFKAALPNIEDATKDGDNK